MWGVVRIKWPPRFQDAEDKMYQLPHDTAHNNFAILSLSLQTMIEGLNDRVTLNGYQRRHIEGLP